MIISEMVIILWKPHTVAPLVGAIHFLFLSMTCKESISRESTSDSFDNRIIDWILIVQKGGNIVIYFSWFSLSSMIIQLNLFGFLEFGFGFQIRLLRLNSFMTNFCLFCLWLKMVPSFIWCLRFIIFIGESPFFCPAEQVCHVLTASWFKRFYHSSLS